MKKMILFCFTVMPGPLVLIVVAKAVPPATIPAQVVTSCNLSWFLFRQTSKALLTPIVLPVMRPEVAMPQPLE
jgi:hypothetical protein